MWSSKPNLSFFFFSSFFSIILTQWSSFYWINIHIVNVNSIGKFNFFSKKSSIFRWLWKKKIIKILWAYHFTKVYITTKHSQMMDNSLDFHDVSEIWLIFDIHTYIYTHTISWIITLGIVEKKKIQVHIFKNVVLRSVSPFFPRDLWPFVELR